MENPKKNTDNQIVSGTTKFYSAKSFTYFIYFKENLLELPNEILGKIFRFIPKHGDLSLVCSRFFQISIDTKLDYSVALGVRSLFLQIVIRLSNNTNFLS